MPHAPGILIKIQRKIYTSKVILLMYNIETLCGNRSSKNIQLFMAISFSNAEQNSLFLVLHLMAMDPAQQWPAFYSKDQFKSLKTCAVRSQAITLTLIFFNQI
jgi:hypothetical protein